MNDRFAALLLAFLMLGLFVLSSCQGTSGTISDNTNVQDTKTYNENTVLPTPNADNITQASTPEPEKTPEITGLPSVYITTDNKVNIPNDKTEVGCSIDLECSVDQFSNKDLQAVIRVRGNGSLSVGQRTGKQSYKLKFDSKINVFGLGDGRAKDWCLLSNTNDRTLLRNYTAKRLGDMLFGIPFSSNTIHVKVFLNGKYIGLYELTEQIEIGSSRVNVDDSHKGNENGFLIELDQYARKGNDPYFRVGNKDYSVKSDIHNDEQLKYVENYIKKVDFAINSGNMTLLDSLVDMGSLVDMYILQEFIKNTDAGYSSFYMCKELGGKLFFTAPWDFDLSSGNDELVDNGDYKNIYVGKTGILNLTHHEWYIKLYTYQWFRDLVKERWSQISDTVIVDLINEVDEKASEIMPGLVSNYYMWCNPPRQIHREPRQVYMLKGAKAHTDFLINWLTNRKNWLDEEWQI